MAISNGMKILITTGIFPPDVGGPAGYADRIAREFVKLGHKVRVLTYFDKNPKSEIRKPKQIQISNDQNLKFLLIRVARRKFKPFAYFDYFLKVLKYAKDADTIYLQDSVSAGLPTTLANLFLRKKLVLKIVGDYAWEMGGNNITPILDEFYPFRGDKYNFKIELLQKIQTWVAKRADKIITPSEYLKKIVNRGWGIDENKIQVIYNALKPIDLKTPDRSSKLIVSVGRLVPWKGFDALIDLMPELDAEIRLRIIGEGPEKEKLEQLIKSKNLGNRVNLLGKLSHNEVIQNLSYTTLFVLNTRYEGLSHILLEALACGAPVITTNVGGNPEVISDYNNGYLVDYNDKFALKSTILKVWRDKNLQEQFRQNGFESLEKFNFNKMVENTLEILKFKNKDLKVLMISTDETILNPESVSAGRMRDYGAICDELHIIVFCCRNRKTQIVTQKNTEKVQLSNNVCAYSTNSLIKPLAILDAYKLGKRLIVNCQLSIVTCQDPFETGIVGWRLARNFKIGLNIQLHGDFFGSRYWREESLLNDIRDKFGRYIMKKADSIRVVSKRIKNSLIEKFNIEENKIIVSPIFTDTEKISKELPKFDLRQKYFGKNPILLSVGRLEREKNYSLLFRAFKNTLKEFPDAILVVVGNGSLNKELKSDVRMMDLQNKIIFEGWQKDLVSYYKTADIYLLTSFYEGWGRTVIESAASGCQIIMTDVGVAGEIIKQNESGFVVEVDNELALTEAIIKSIRQKELKEKFSLMAKEAINNLPDRRQAMELIKSSWVLATHCHSEITPKNLRGAKRSARHINL